MSTCRILVGNVMDRLRELPEGSVHVCVTSPPYWALRAYHTEGQVWGGEPGCPHEWRIGSDMFCTVSLEEEAPMP